MDKNDLIKKLLKKKEMYDYYYIIAFFLIFSFFILYIIKPSLTIAFSLQSELDDLKIIYESYGKAIKKVEEVNRFLIVHRDDVDLVDEAIPQMPETKVVIDDLRNAASQEGVVLNNLSLSSLDLKNEQKSNQLKSLIMQMDVTGQYPSVDKFVKRITNQRRIKTINSFRIGKKEQVKYSSEEAGGVGGGLKVSIELIAYYL